MPMTPEDEVRAILDGIDRTEDLDPPGWWETSTGAEFGAAKLEAVLSVVSVAQRACASCRHWSKAEGPPDVAGSAYRGKGVIGGEWGTCERIIRLGENNWQMPPTLEEPTEDPAYLSDGSGYFASLTTRSDFGCSLWEAHEDGYRAETDR